MKPKINRPKPPPKQKLSRSTLPSKIEIELRETGERLVEMLDRTREALLKSDMRVLELTEELRDLKVKSQQLLIDFNNYVQQDIRNPYDTLNSLRYEAEVFQGEFDFDL